MEGQNVIARCDLKRYDLPGKSTSGWTTCICRVNASFFEKMSSLQCNYKTDGARVSLAIARFPNKVHSLRMAVDGVGGATLYSNCICISRFYLIGG